MNARIPLVLLLVLGCRGARSADGPVAGAAFVPRFPIAEIDVEHYALDLALFPPETRMEGTCTMRLFAQGDGPHTLALDLAGLEAVEVLDGRSRALEFVHEEGRLFVTWEEATPAGDAITLRVAYRGRPAKGLWWVTDGSQEPLVFTHGQCDESHWWFPCHDVPWDRATSQLRVSMPASWTSVAAGERTESRVEGERRSEEWRMPTAHPVYLTTLVAGPLESVESEWNGVPLVYLAPREWAPLLAESLQATGPAMEYFSDLLGMRYPYRKYAQACVPGFPFGGMENVSATTLTVDALSDAAGLRDHRPDVLVAHEVAHQWIGNLVTVADWSDIWIQEGLATYLSLMFIEHALGPDEFRAAIREKRAEYLRADRGRRRRSIAYDVYENPSDLFGGGHAYQGGATRFHLLRFLLGDADFRSGLRILVGRHAGGSIGTEDVRAAFEQASGRDLERFFEQWVLSPGYPEIETRWRYDASRGRVILSVHQVQSIEDGTPSAFKAPVLVEIMSSSGAQLVRIEMEKRRAKVELPCDGEPLWVSFDKHRWLPAELSPEKRLQEWFSILAQSDDVSERLDALDALEAARSSVSEAERGAIDERFRACLLRDPAPLVRGAAAARTALSLSPEARAALESVALEDPDLAARRMALGALALWCPDGELADLAQDVFDDGESWATMGAAARLRVAAAPESGLAWVRARLGQTSPNQILRRHLLSALGGLPEAGATEELRRWLNDPAAFDEVRAEAARQLTWRATGPGSAAQAVRADLIRALGATDGRFRRALIDVLARIDHGDVRAALATYHQATVHDRERRAIEAALTAR